MTLDMPRHKLRIPSVVAMRYVARMTPDPMLEEPEGLIICILVCAPFQVSCAVPISANISHVFLRSGRGAYAAWLLLRAHLDGIDRVHYDGWSARMSQEETRAIAAGKPAQGRPTAGRPWETYLRSARRCRRRRRQSCSASARSWAGAIHNWRSGQRFR